MSDDQVRRDAVKYWLASSTEDRVMALVEDASLADWIAAELEQAERLVAAAKDLHERVEMDESVGICLADRVPSLRLGQALAAYERATS